MNATVYEVQNAGLVILGWTADERLARDTADAIEREHDIEVVIREREYDEARHEAVYHIPAATIS